MTRYELEKSLGLSRGRIAVRLKNGWLLEKAFTTPHTPPRDRVLRHGLTKTRAHNSWLGMRKRCLNPNSKCYQYYGGRGISYCPRWEIFENFLEDMGTPPKGTTLDRIDSNGNYSKANCRWVDHTTQMNNTRRNYIEFNGKKCRIHDIEKSLGLGQGNIRRRLTKGWTVEKACTQPSRNKW